MAAPASPMILQDMVVILLLAIAVVLVCHRLKLPPVVGLLATGVLAGPHGLGLVSAVHDVELMAEFGVVLLLFVIGLELSPRELIRLRKPVFVGGALQVGLTVLAVVGLTMLMGASPSQAVFDGFVVSLSSTAIVLKLLAERCEMDTPHGRLGLSILIFQDMAVVGMMLLVPFLAGGAGGAGEGSLWPALGLALGKMVLLLVVVLVLSRRLVRYVLRSVLRTRSREMFLLTVLAVCLAVAWLTAAAGLSLALGAFLAGLVVSESEFSLSALEGMLPFRDVFTSFFFVSIGMLLDIGFVASELPLVLALAVGIMLLKAVLGFAAVRAIGYPARPSLATGMILAQVGEFSFVLAGVGGLAGLMDGRQTQLFLAAAILTLAVTPFLVAAGPALAQWLVRSSAPEPGEGHAHGLSEHLLIVGFGVGGRHLAKVARARGIPYQIIELNPDTVRQEAAKGEPIVYGDAIYSPVLEHLGAARARVLAVVISDATAVRRIVSTARGLNPGLTIIARTPYVSEIEPLRAAGADQVVCQEFETAIEMFARVMAAYLVPLGEIEASVAEVRARGYSMLRPAEVPGQPLCDVVHRLGEMDVQAVRLEPGAELEGIALADSALRADFGLTVVAISREGELLPTPAPEERFQAGDVVYLLGPPAKVQAAAERFDPVRRSTQECAV